ncbi:MAG: hypothetical protein OXG44_09175 [Gammaproteobacteria bacterium]|nr:hypothetical protein [Gammaproteobacteria bacterium]
MPRLSETVRLERDRAVARIADAVAAKNRAHRNVVLAAIDALGEGVSLRDVAHHTSMDHRTLKREIDRVTGGRIG